MSFCRFSDDDYRSDIYAYESVSGSFEIMVAMNRHANPDPRPNPGPIPTDKADIDAWTKIYLALNNWLGAATVEPIGLGSDGKRFSFSTPGEAADKLEELRASGYNVPQRAIDDLREEQKIILTEDKKE
jgi:hypothetical protein